MINAKAEGGNNFQDMLAAMAQDVSDFGTSVALSPRVTDIWSGILKLCSTLGEGGERRQVASSYLGRNTIT